MRLFLILALMAAPSTAVMARPLHETDMAAVAKKARSVSVSWIDSLPSPECDPAFTDSLRFTRCHAVRAVRKRGIEGTVVLQALVGVDGSVKEVKVTRGIDELDQAAIEAVKEWKFRPAHSKGQPIETWVMVPVLFHF